MHLLASQSGTIGDGNAAVDLAQDPAEIVILSAADSELACLARAHDSLREPKPSLRLASLLSLQHHYSVDLYVQRTLAQARLIILRLLGGKSYWPYGLKAVEALARERGLALAVLPGDQIPDPDLARHGTLNPIHAEQLRLYLAEGGPENAANALRFAQHLLAGGRLPALPKSFPQCGVYGPRPENGPVALIIFYRSLLASGYTAPIDALVASLRSHGLESLCVHVQSLKEKEAAALIGELCAQHSPSVIVNTTGFAVATQGGQAENPLQAADCPVLQAVLAGSSEAEWRNNPQGLGPRDLAMNVVLPELDGRVMTRALSFKADAQFHAPTQCRIMTYQPQADRIDFVSSLAANWMRLRCTPASERRIAIVLANYPNREGRIGNGVGYDTPASTLNILKALTRAGYSISDIPDTGNALVEALLRGPTNAHRRQGSADASLSVHDYMVRFEQLPASVRQAVHDRWGLAQDDPFYADGLFNLPVRRYGNALVAIQPARGYNIDPKSTYHDPALVPPHGYFAFYIWLREIFRAHAVIHNGKHGNLEWLPGKAVALSDSCFPEAVLGPLPHLYPFIVNDPGEGTQAKRRTSAVIIDHLTPPLTRAEAYGPLRELETLVDEYYLASGVDRRRISLLRRRIFDAARSARIDLDAGIEDESDLALQKLDAWLCDLKEAQIRDGLHVLGESPQGRLEVDLLAALLRNQRGLGEGEDQSLLHALASDLGLGFDPLACDFAKPWTGPRPGILEATVMDPWRSYGDTVERMEAFAAQLIECPDACPAGFAAINAVLDCLEKEARPRLRACGAMEIANLLKGLDGKFVAPGPSGAPTRGRLDVLPTGRNFYSVDNRAVPTPTAWSLGTRSAEAMLL
ncbi:MAG TPA: cobaltochelatase subunit CobN, partial [Aestuariivirgaceae bacterium]